MTYFRRQDGYMFRNSTEHRCQLRNVQSVQPVAMRSAEFDIVLL